MFTLRPSHKRRLNKRAAVCIRRQLFAALTLAENALSHDTAAALGNTRLRIIFRVRVRCSSTRLFFLHAIKKKKQMCFFFSSLFFQEKLALKGGLAHFLRSNLVGHLLVLGQIINLVGLFHALFARALDFLWRIRDSKRGWNPLKFINNGEEEEEKKIRWFLLPQPGRQLLRLEFSCAPFTDRLTR